MGTYEWKVEDDRATWDETAYALWDVPPGTPVTRGMVRARVHPDDVAAFDADMARAMDPQGDGLREVTYRVMSRDGERVLRWLHVRAQMEFAPDGTPSRMVGVNRDVTDLKRAEAQRELLIRELDHRVKNLFAVIVSILSLARRRHGDSDALVAAVRPRIEALARAHGSSIGRHAAEEGVALETLLANVLAPHRDGTGRIALRGPAVDLPVSAITPLGLTVHELATNAAKHGALSVEGGRVAVTWEVADGTLAIDWRETGGPAAERTAGGFGATLLEATTAQLRGTLETETGADGLRVRIAFPVSA
nr:sensor histidine kinase [Jannaschia sp. Os4]